MQFCTACHGVDDRHSKENVPPLGGRTYEDLIVVMPRVKDIDSLQTLLEHALSDEVRLTFPALSSCLTAFMHDAC